MKVEHIHPCEAPKCKDAAYHIVRLDNGKALLKVCTRHIDWGKKRGIEVENS
jgi:hypothetical protein